MLFFFGYNFTWFCSQEVGKRIDKNENLCREVEKITNKVNHWLSKNLNMFEIEKKKIENKNKIRISQKIIQLVWEWSFGNRLCFSERRLEIKIFLRKNWICLLDFNVRLENW